MKKVYEKPDLNLIKMHAMEMLSNFGDPDMSGSLEDEFEDEE